MKSKIIIGLLILGLAKTYGQDNKSDSLKKDNDSEKVYVNVENPAEFPGGIMALGVFLNNNTKYPKTAKRAGIKGKVFIEFIINKIGGIDSVKVVPFSKLQNFPRLVESDIVTDVDCVKEAIRVVTSFPIWTPASHHGQPLKTKNILPIQFRPQ